MTETIGKTRLPTMGEVITIMVGFIAIMFLYINVFDLPIQLALFSAWFLVMGLGRVDVSHGQP
ncbi:hypothetical protein P1P91_13070 [Halomonas piscis]|uniref:Uncharacterized protein n=1 Tax=Halomonas piscis TaxID=3031727 RepID=A0ABY9YYU2_9GAMM|nr:hypothetical protein [Halomonas piscis]WNK19748.1 hypothetical protein P1P91_13070 [Halomonas piscis]